MSVSIKVAIRCRPYTIDDKLGVYMIQNSEEDGEVNLINSTYSTTRFAFSWAWWSAYGWQKHQKGNENEAEDMKLVNSEAVYECCGLKIKGELIDGNAIVLFAYGLSGSGKTFTVFGPDAADIPEAWFKWDKPHGLWGVFPHLAYDLFNEAEQTWKFQMKYFQNVVDIVRDLMSPTGEERSYKEGMRKDGDGFMDILWCLATQMKTWDDLRTTFLTANARKAIAPTQFNPQSTRGHCIMTLEVNKPKEDDNTMRMRGRVYICDLAGTEPAGDIVYASYKKIKFPDGSVENQYQGPHRDQSRTKQLQNQGKKINLSLSEMAQFFMKMANAIKAKKLAPGKSIPGCNSYFLCKYLKDIMLQARTYLFCAIRPEATYLNYTFSTLGFAKNASVIKLTPKKATTAASPAERKLMQQLEQMKAMMAELKKQNEALVASGGGGGSDARTAELEAKLAEQEKREAEMAAREAAAQKRQAELEAKLKNMELAGGGGGDVEELKKQLEAQKAEAAAAQAELQAQKAEFDATLESEEGGAALVARRQLQAKLAAQAANMNSLSAGDADNSVNLAMEKQRQEYGQRGIALAHFDADTDKPHLVNIDQDPFRNQRFLYIITRDSTTIGSDKACDIKPFGMGIAAQHCKILKDGEGNCTLVALEGDVIVNGKKLKKDESAALALYDWVAIASEVSLFRSKSLMVEGSPEPPDAEQILAEFRAASRSAEEIELEARMAEFERKKQEWDAQQGKKKLSAAEEEERRKEMEKMAMEMVNKEIMQLLPLTKEAKLCCDQLGRDMLSFEVQMQRGTNKDNAAPTVKVKVHKEGATATEKQDILIETFEFERGLATIKDEIRRIQFAIDNGRSYTSPEGHDPIKQFMDRTTHYGTAITFPEYLGYFLQTDDSDINVDIKSSMALDKNVGRLSVNWIPWFGEDGQDEPPEYDDPEDMIGKEWSYKLIIENASGFDIMCSRCYVSYHFWGQDYNTEEKQQETSSPNFGYDMIHTVNPVTQEFLDFLQEPLHFVVYAAPFVTLPPIPISTSNPQVVSNITGRPVEEGATTTLSLEQLQGKVISLDIVVAEKTEENEALKSQVESLQKEVAALKEQLAGGTSRVAAGLEEARQTDAAINS
mgnify:CR=1 FL=1|mmetsp:Transcript_54398/g.80711  ORF Transcript_54398/g.80711 Transcript_54398/m.80711 type:complete len:1117 (-) Transcript_54398:19-3369(-)|eukprot:CAMPEP_0195529014 /NCGR_PEP_ID=MMETSP0794_2-20130614/31411_1 /TAXON_ID=515487 /ORGANISM="Stephanopyxis turris, Strain CCMP 815" /LENGTH=1116 /DNA_ID=CAMNT_0040660251 /DNA_START=148 /DNA_END=3498 /DNA_ORIENTATION=+